VVPPADRWTLSPGGCAKAAEKAPEEAPADAARAAEEPQLLHGVGICKWFNVRMGFGFLSMTARAGVALDPPVDVFVHQVRLILVTLLEERKHAWVGGRLCCWIGNQGP
jgi:protein lin-28